MPKPEKRISDCHEAPVIKTGDGEDDYICTRCKEKCWGCLPSMLKPISLQQLRDSLNRSRNIP